MPVNRNKHVSVVCYARERDWLLKSLNFFKDDLGFDQDCSFITFEIENESVKFEKNKQKYLYSFES